MQDEYWRLRSNLVHQINRNLIGIAEEFPGVGDAHGELTGFLERHPDHAFKTFRPEDLHEDTCKGEGVCLR